MHEDENFNEELDKNWIRKKLTEIRDTIKEWGVKPFQNGTWLAKIIQKSFRNYWEKGNAEYFLKKYKRKDKDYVCKKLINVTSKNAMILGGVVGATVSIDEITAAIDFLPTLGLTIPAQVALAISVLTGEAIFLVKMQLQLVANIAKIYGVELDPDDPEDILTILAFAVGGSIAEEASKFGMKIGKKLTENTVKGVFKKEILEYLQKVGTKLGLKILQRTMVNYTVPLASIGIGMTVNYFATKKIGKLARDHFIGRLNEK